LVEFCFGIPIEQHLKPGYGKWLLRRSLRNILPPSVAQRKDKGNPAEAYARAVVRNRLALNEIAKGRRACALGYVDRRTLDADLSAATHAVPHDTRRLLKVLVLELWLREWVFPGHALEVKNS
jgi:asparagine synthase (glutamine-hydrolysing)